MKVWTRVIPCLLLSGRGFVKTLKFRDPKYLGDPRNIVRIFNEKEADELVILDITATREGRGPNLELVGEIVDEAFVPVAYGGGITSIDHARQLFSLGVEKVVINTAAFENPELLTDVASEYGVQSLVASIDVKRSLLRRPLVHRRGRKRTRFDPLVWARRLVDLGAGEILLQSVDRDGTMEGYDLQLVDSVASELDVPVVACGGAGSVEDLGAVVQDAHASAAAAGSLFVFQGRHRAVLVSFPDHDDLARVGLRPE
ncbi:MAG: AglZ/HisF2 family acetamidino modification protein [Dehalococcoidia bacterium]